MISQEIPKTSLGFFPTPVSPLKNLSRLLGGPEIFIKRDDLTGLAFGGNKTRKLEYLLGEALSQQADTVITAGAAQSNHCRQTAAAAAMLGLECHLVLGGTEPKAAKGNLLLDRLFGSRIHWSGVHRKGEDIPELLNLPYNFSAGDVHLNSDYTGEGYGVVGANEREAISLTARTEGILLDPVYTGRAMGRRIGMIRLGKFSRQDRILFWHTGGTPALFVNDIEP